MVKRIIAAFSEMDFLSMLYKQNKIHLLYLAAFF